MAEMMAAVEEMKRRKIFVSLIMTRTGTQLSWWDAGKREVVTGDVASARLHLRALHENDRREVERAGRMMGVSA